MSFKALDISSPIQRSLSSEGYQHPTPIQAQSIPPLLKGKDLLGCAQTGTGKTAAFAIPILQALAEAKNEEKKKGKPPIRALVLAPTRELAIQIGESFSTYGRYLSLKHLTIFGGVSQHPQTKALNRGVDVLVATPGRLLDLIGQGYVSLDKVSHFVLDEADRMLDMGMLRDVRKIIDRLPKVRQTMFFSATMPKEIASLAQTILKDPVRVEVTPVSSPVDVIDQSVYYVNKKNKIRLLTHLLKTKDYDSVLVFSRTKHGCDKIVRQLDKQGVRSQAIHGNKSQNARQRALGNFKAKKVPVLIATDIAARGIDVEELSLVINYDLPEVAETYVHRIGRTGRAGLGGQAIAFCDGPERPLLRQIERLIGRKISRVTDQPFPYDEKDDRESPAYTGDLSNQGRPQRRAQSGPRKKTKSPRQGSASRKASKSNRTANPAKKSRPRKQNRG